MEVEENKWLIINQQLVTIPKESVSSQVPRRQIGPLVLKDGHTSKLGRPSVQVFLICKLSIFESVAAPLKALLAPPVETA